jgi:hypothetical protein
MTGTRNTLPPAALAWSIWGLGAALYFIGFYQRVAPAVITTELTQTFALTAAALGNLSAFYFYSYVAMQIPTGILADRFGPRVLLTVGGFVAALGTAVFATATDVMWANMGGCGVCVDVKGRESLDACAAICDDLWRGTCSGRIWRRICRRAAAIIGKRIWLAQRDVGQCRRHGIGRYPHMAARAR